MSKVWLVTGSSRGLGRALAGAVLAAGDRLVATARDPAQLSDLVTHYGDRVRAVALDVTDADAARAAIGEAVSVFGRLDVLVNNAGYGDVGSIEDMPDDVFRAQIETNLFGVVNVTRAAIPVMREQRAGHIIQISSIGGRTSAPGVGAYQTAKWGVEGFSGVLAQEVEPLGIHVTIVEPGGFRTDWAGSSMTIRDSHPDYDPTIGTIVEYRKSRGGAEPGDPAKAAAAIIHIAGVAKPPLRLLLGSDAVHLAERYDRARTQSDLKWRNLSLSTDYEGSPA